MSRLVSLLTLVHLYFSKHLRNRHFLPFETGTNQTTGIDTGYAYSTSSGRLAIPIYPTCPFVLIVATKFYSINVSRSEMSAANVSADSVREI